MSLVSLISRSNNELLENINTFQPDNRLMYLKIQIYEKIRTHVMPHPLI